MEDVKHNSLGDEHMDAMNAAPQPLVMEPEDRGLDLSDSGTHPDFKDDGVDPLEDDDTWSPQTWRMIYLVLKLIAVAAIVAITVVALSKDAERALPLVYLDIGFLVVFALARGYQMFKEPMDAFGANLSASFNAVLSNKTAVALLALIIGGAVVLTVALIVDDASRLVSALGLVTFIFFSWLFSRRRSHVKWRPVVMGFLIQFVLGLVILRSDPGKNTFQFLGDQTTALLDYSKAGASFVYGFLATGLPPIVTADALNGQLALLNVTAGELIDAVDNATDAVNRNFDNVTISIATGNANYGTLPVFAPFAFFVLPTVIFFSAIVSVLFYLGVLQFVIRVLGRGMAFLLGTSASESLNAAGNIFVGQTEAPLLIRPFLKDMTESELHAVMTGGFATIAGGVLVAFIGFGISATHLLGASVMSAPAALAISKLIVPETRQSKTAAGSDYVIDLPAESNIIEAASNGAATAVPLTLNIAGQLIAFLGIVAMLNGWLAFVGELIDVPELSFEFICGYAFFPIAWIMGVDADDCFVVANLLGKKVFVNEFAAYQDLAVFIDNGEISRRSEIIATYALCGFSNFSSIGIQLGGLGPLAPNQIKKLTKHVFSAMIAGNIACFMTACIAGLLYDPARQ